PVIPHVRLPRLHLQVAVDESAGRVVDDDARRLPVHLQPARPILLDARGVEETVELGVAVERAVGGVAVADRVAVKEEDRKSTRLNSSHVKISYAVFCLKKKKK